MPIYRITAPNGQTYQIEGPPGASDAEVAQAVLAQYPESGQPVKKSTVGSELKRGAQQLASGVQTAYGAVTGSPEEAAKAGLERGEAISQVAGEGASFDAVKKAYQEKGLLSAAGELASQVPRALAGQGANLAAMAGGARLGAMAGSPLGPAGVIGGGVLGAGAALYPQLFGSNVESQAAAQMERGEPVKIDRTKAGVAAAGQAALEGAGAAFTLGKGIVKGVLGIVDDAAITSAKTARQLEATAQRSLTASAGRGVVRGAAVEMPVEVAQQVIERAQAGQDLTSDDAFKAYGDAAYQAGLVGGPLGAAGNVVNRGQAKDKAAAAAAERAKKDAEIAAQPGPQLPPEAPVGTQGTMFTPEEMGKPVPEPKAPKEPVATAVPEGQQDLGLDFQREYPDLVQERERLKQQPQTPEVKARVQELTDQMALYTQSDIESLRAEKEGQAAAAAEDAATRKKFPALAEAPDLLTQPDEVKARTQGELFPSEDLAGPTLREKGKPAAEKPAEPTPAPPYARTGPYQYKLPLRGGEVAQPLTMQNVLDTGIPLATTRKWFEQNVVGKTQGEVQALVDKDPTLLDGPGKRAKVLRELLAPQAAPFKETPRVEPTPAPTTAVEPRAEPRAGEPSVGVLSEPAPAELAEPGAGVPPTAAAPVAPDGRGLVSAGRPAVQGDETASGEPPAVTPPVERTADVVHGEVRALEAEQQKLLTKAGRIPAVKSPARAKWDALDAQIAQKKEERDALDRAQRTAAPVPAKPVAVKPTAASAPAPAVETETAAAEAARKAEAEDFKRRLEALETAKPAAPKATPAPAPKAEKPTPKEIPEKLREPVGTSEIGMEEGEKEILRGPQAMLFPMSKREEIEYAERKRGEPEAAAEPTAARDERQMELDFTKEPELEPAAPTKTATPSDEATLKAISGKPMVEVAQWAAQNLPDPDQKVIAQRVLVKLRQLQDMGVVLNPIKVTDAGRRLVGAKGVTELRGKRAVGGPATITITLNHPANGELSGTNPATILHELLHAATMGVINVGQYTSSGGTKVGAAVDDLIALRNAVVRRLKDRVSSGATLTDFEQRAYDGMNNALADSHEVLVWSLTSREMQQYMESIPYKGQTAWNKFVTYVRDLLGIPAKADTALSEALRVGDTLLGLTKEEMAGAQKQTGKQFQVSFSTESLIDSMGPLEAQEKPMLRKVIDGFKDQTEVGYAVKFRTQVADSAATIEHRLREQFDGAVKDKLGKFNPMGLYRQAQDYSKMLLEYMQVGAIAKEPATGLWKVKADPKVRPPVEVYSLIDKWAAKNGYSRERGTQIASRILEGVRLDAMRTSNKNDGTSFLLHLKDTEIDQLVREYKADPDLQAMSKAMDEARIAMVDNMVAVGRLTKETGEAWKDSIGYVPFDRLEDEKFSAAFSKIKKISNKGLAQVGKLPELVGSINRPVGNVFDNYLNTLGWMVGQTIKTDGTVQTLRSLEDAGHAKYLGRSPQGKDNAVGMYVKGEMMYWELPSKYDVLAFKELAPPKAKWLQVLGQASNVLRKAVTVLPPFALKQVTDDVQRAIMTSGVKNPGALLRMTLSNFGGLALAELRGIQHPTVKEFGALGLTGEYDFQQGKPAMSVLKDLGYKPRGKFETLIHRLDGITRASDLAVRKAIYDQTLNEGGDQLLAQTRAREFINFRRRGASQFVGDMVATIPFFNAYIQGMDVLYRAASGKDSSSSVGRAQARRMFWSRAAIAMTLSSLYALGKGDDDEDYNEMDLRTRDSNWILPGGFKLPVPTELGALFKVIPERVVEYMRRQGTPEEQEAWEATRTALSYIFEQYVGRVVPVPQGVKPLLEAWMNYSTFTGRELEGIYQKQQDPSLRRASNTSELAIAIAEFSKKVVGVDLVSPILIDNALNGYFGSTAGLLVAVTDSLLNPTRVDRPLHKYALVSNYMYDPVGTRRMTEFYDAREKVGRANTTLAELMRTDLDKAAVYAEEHADELMLESAVNSTLEQLERTRAYKKYLNSKLAAEDMTSDERADQIKEIRQMEVELASWLREAKASLRQ